MPLTEILIIFLIVLLFYGVWRMPKLARDLKKAINQPDKPSHARRQLIFGLVGGVALIVPLILGVAGVISDEQMAIVIFVFVVWLIVGFYCYIKVYQK